MQDLLAQLNAVQREAVTHPGGPLLIFAGAGSGKTRVLTYRVAYLIREQGVYPSQILAVTFTNKAANEMKARIVDLVGPLQESMWIGTFHALSARLLRIHGHHIGLDRDFVIYDEQDQETVVKECLREKGIDDKRWTPRSILGAISRAKEKLIGPDEFAADAQGAHDRVVATIYPLYTTKLRANHALDFDDLIAFAVQLLRDCPEVRQELRHRFRHILVDEFQDINQSQYTWTRLLAGSDGNIVVVGDDDQSIYSWRGADVRFILAFEKDHPNTRVVKLEQNYRSSANILRAAHEVVRRNSSRAPKQLWTERPSGPPIVIRRLEDEKEEAAYVAMQVAAGIATGTRHYRDYAVLYRTNSQSRPFEDEFRRTGIPYRVVGGLRFYEHKEVKDLLAYLRILVNPADSVSLRRILNVPPRGIGTATLARLNDLAAARGIPLIAAMRQAADIAEITPAIRRRVASFVATLDALREAADVLPVDELLRQVVTQTGFEASLEGKTPTETLMRRANVQELGSIASDFTHRATNKTLAAFLEEMALASDVDALREDEEGVVLMTLHAAKGLEFPVVFLAGMEEGLFPHSRSQGDNASLEEERRLCYVGITRAQDEVYLLHAGRRTTWGSMQYNPPSRFLRELPPATLDERADVTPVSPRRVAAQWDGGAARGNASQPEVRRQAAAADDAAVDVSAILARHRPAEPAFTRGEKVRHALFGEGVVLALHGSGADTEATVHFAGHGTKRLHLQFAPLEAVAPEEPAEATVPVLARGDRVTHARFGEGVVVTVHGEGPGAEVSVRFADAGTRRLDPATARLRKA
ncbi:MAG: UvrD-helicase domain-containing protein [Armatimonadetes bacterium]|nr:UvrD-helicase domain-containing protein [Armatimonadota bacterium]